LSYLPAKWRWLTLLLATLSLFANAEQTPDHEHWATPIDTRIKLYQMDAKLFRSALPDRQAISQFKQLDIGTVINFYQKSDKSWIGEERLQEVHLPLRTRWFNDEDALDALRAVRAAQEKGPVLIHCKHGQNRTGLVAALYRMVYQGWSKEEALAEMRSFGGSIERMKHAEDYLADVDVDEIKEALASGACHTSVLAWCHVGDWFESLAQFN